MCACRERIDRAVLAAPSCGCAGWLLQPAPPSKSQPRRAVPRRRGRPAPAGARSAARGRRSRPGRRGDWRARAPAARGRALGEASPRLPTRRGAQRSPLPDARHSSEIGVRERGCARRASCGRARGCVCVESASGAARRRAMAGRGGAPARVAARVAGRRDRTITSSRSGSLPAAAGGRGAVMCPI